MAMSQLIYVCLDHGKKLFSMLLNVFSILFDEVEEESVSTRTIDTHPIDNTKEKQFV